MFYEYTEIDNYKFKNFVHMSDFLYNKYTAIMNIKRGGFCARVRFDLVS